MSIHRLTPTRETVHGYFSRDLQPVPTIDSGDTVVFETLDAGWKLGPDPGTGELEWNRHVDWYDPDTDKGHALGGPVQIRGAEPGMTLEVRIGEIRTGRWGWAVGGGWKSYFNERRPRLDHA
jgi:acetamidase/formamidase